MEGGPCPLLAKAPASGSPARSSSTKRVPPYPWYLRARRTSSSVASAGVRKPSSGIACRGVCCRGGPRWTAQNRPGRSERGGLAVRLIQGQRLIPLKVAHHLLKARALVEAVRPECLHLLLRNFVRRPFHAPALGPRVAQLGYLAAHGLRQPAHVVQVPLPLLRLPALPKPIVEGPRLLQFSVALQQQRLQVIAGVRLVEPPEHPRLVARLD